VRIELGRSASAHRDMSDRFLPLTTSTTSTRASSVPGSSDKTEILRDLSSA